MKSALPVVLPPPVAHNEVLDDHSATSSEWALQMKENDEADAWEASFPKIPIEVQPKFETFLGGLPAARRIQVYQLIDRTGWELDNCNYIYATIKGCAVSMQESMIQLLHEFRNMAALNHVIKLYPRLAPEVVEEMLTAIDRSYMIEINTDITRHLKDNEVDYFIQLSQRLGLRSVLNMFEDCKEPWADKCRLCRKRRLYALHHRLEHNQMPEGMAEVPGVLPLIEHAQKWAADDEKGFHFDVENARVYWERELVDVVRICDACLNDMYAAASCCSRFDEIFHIPAADRKAAMTKQRKKELAASELFGKIFISSVWRRLREFSIRSIKTARHGNRLESDERLRLETLEKLRLAKEKAEREHKAMIDGALAVDKKWKKEDRTADDIAFQRHKDYIDLKTHVGFSKSNPAPRDREHPMSWRLAHTDTRGITLTDEAAAKRFGRAALIVQPQEKSLKEWKEETLANHLLYEQDQQLIKEEEGRAKHIHCMELNQYVDRRIIQINRTYKRIQLTLECVEENRIAKRKAEKDHRRAVRIAGYEAEERSCMGKEDAHSWQRRFFDQENARMWHELALMSAAESSQRGSGDSFWGIDEAARKEKELQNRLRALWEAKVEEMREACIRVRITKPFVEEVRHKVFRDKITNKVIK